MTTVTRPLETGWLADTPADDTLLRRFLHNQAESNAALAVAGGGRVERRPDAVLTAYDMPIAYYRQAVLFRPLTGLDDELLDAAEGVLAGGASTLLSAWPTPDLANRGWMLVGHPTFVVRAPGLALPSARSGVSVRVASSADDFAVAERLAVVAYPLPEADGLTPNAVFGAGLLSTPQLLRIGSLDGEPAAVGASYISHGVVNLCLAATLPAGRRRGLWQALAAARIADGPGLPAAAITSDFSRPGFEQLGFLPVTRFTMWLRP